MKTEAEKRLEEIEIELQEIDTRLERLHPQFDCDMFPKLRGERSRLEGERDGILKFATPRREE